MKLATLLTNSTVGAIKSLCTVVAGGGFCFLPPREKKTSSSISTLPSTPSTNPSNTKPTPIAEAPNSGPGLLDFFDTMLSRGAFRGASGTFSSRVFSSMHAQQQLSLETLNPLICRAKYAVRGAVVAAAAEVEKSIQRGERPFKEVVYCTPHLFFVFFLSFHD